MAAVHAFGKSMGIAAPQIGIERAAAIVRPPGTADMITLLNPRIIETGDETDEQYEGCLSFFDVRCLVNRPLVIHVEHQDVNGDRRITIFERGVARLVAHEIDHLHGILCRDHLPQARNPFPLSSTAVPALAGSTMAYRVEKLLSLAGHGAAPSPAPCVAAGPGW